MSYRLQKDKTCSGKEQTLEIGITKEQTILVTEELTAQKMGSGLLPVYATPCMIALMENKARTSVESFLEEGQGTVGPAINIKHTAATPVGMKVTSESKLLEVDRKRLVFEVKAYDEAGEIGSGTHERFIIENEKFMKRAEGKKQN